MNPYQTLGIDREETLAGINAAYRRKAKKLHPDAGGDSAEFDAVNRAYRVLKDPEARAEFDKTGEMPEEKFDTTYETVVKIAIQCFGAAVEGSEFYTRRDIIADAKANCHKLLADIDRQNAKALADQAKLEDLIARLAVADGKNNPIVAHLKGMLTGVTEAIPKIAMQKHLHMRALGLLGDYTYRADVSQSPTAILGTVHGFASTSATGY